MEHNPIRLVILVSFNHIGDYNQALEVEKLYKKSASLNFSVAMLNVEDNEFITIFQKMDYEYIHSIGEKGMIKIATLMSEGSQLTKEKSIIVQIHQHFQELLAIRPKYLIIPETNYRHHQQLYGTKKILLMGTLFQKISDDQLKQIYYQSTISAEININSCYLIVMLSGDAPDGQKMKFFTKQSADILLMRIAYLLAIQSIKGLNCKVIVQNGPRTGKHDHQTGKQKCLHKYNQGQDPSLAIDQISQYFIGKLKYYHVDFCFFNFSFEQQGNKRIVHSFYKPLLYVAQQQHNMFLFPMESVSMISELPYYINTSQLYAYHTSSTNKSHMQFVQKGFQRGLYRMFVENQWNLKSPHVLPESEYDENQKMLQIIIQDVRKQSQVAKQYEE